MYETFGGDTDNVNILIMSPNLSNLALSPEHSYTLIRYNVRLVFTKK